MIELSLATDRPLRELEQLEPEQLATMVDVLGQRK